MATESVIGMEGQPGVQDSHRSYRTEYTEAKRSRYVKYVRILALLYTLPVMKDKAVVSIGMGIILIHATTSRSVCEIREGTVTMRDFTG